MIKENVKIILNSNKEIFLFQSLENQGISYNIYDCNLKFLGSQILDDKNIICYDLYIDERDVLHLVSLVESGELIYYKFIDNKWSSGIIGQFDLDSNIYKQIEIFFIKSKLNIIYNISNFINSNVWTIQHVVYDDTIKERHNITRYISTKNPEPFVIDFDSKGTIHLVYNPNINKSQVFHSFYNPFSNSWSSKPNKISDENKTNLFPYSFIDTMDNIHILWLEHDKDKYYIKYLKMNSKGKEKYIWKKVKFLDIPVSKYPPILFEEDNTLKLLFVSDSSLKLIKSRDYGNSWSDKEESCDINENTTIIKTKSSIDSETTKINYLYCKIKDKIKFYFLNTIKEPINIIKEDIKIKKEEHNIIIGHQNNDANSIMYSELNKKLNNILENQNSMEELIAEILNYEKDINSKLDNIYEFTKPNQKTIFQRLFDSTK